MGTIPVVGLHKIDNCQLFGVGRGESRQEPEFTPFLDDGPGIADVATVSTLDTVNATGMLV